LAGYLPAQPGEIRTPGGEALGEHAGVFYYTLGQRGGLGIGGRREADAAPWYVVGKDVGANVLYVAQGNTNHWLHSRALAASEATWTAGAAPAAAFRCSAMVRYRQLPQACAVVVDGGGCH